CASSKTPRGAAGTRSWGADRGDRWSSSSPCAAPTRTAPSTSPPRPSARPSRSSPPSPTTSSASGWRAPSPGS
ncbi:MAG: hypothetical protein AVDCRST_MAG89-1511, partial [uncultured Gemmatimonadetes bacterium]